MASQYYGLNRGAQDGATAAVTTGSSTTGKSLEVVVDLTGNRTRAEVILGLQRIIYFIENERTTPFAQ